MGKIDNTYTWKVGEQVRAKRVEEKIPLNPTTAGESRSLSLSLSLSLSASLSA